MPPAAPLRYLVIIALAVLLFVPFLGHVHLFDWDEVNFAECAREMIVSKQYLRVQIDFQPFWEKPPLFIWLQVLSMKLFGINEFAARFPNAMIGVATLLTIYHAGRRIVSERMAQWWVLLYAASWLPHLYFKSGIIDPLFNLMIFCAYYQVQLMRFNNRKFLHAALSGLFLGLAVLTKGPVAILVAGISLVTLIALDRGLKGYTVKNLLVIALTAIITISLWFGTDILLHGWWFVREFITYQVRLFQTQDAGHGGPFYYHFLVLLIGCFPAAPFLFQYHRRSTAENIERRDFGRWMWILFWVTLILFSIVKTKIIHYSSLCYFPLTYLAAVQLSRLEGGTEKLKRGVYILLVAIGTGIALALIGLPIVGINKDRLVPYIHDDAFAVANLRAAVSWQWAECLYGLSYLVLIIFGALLLRKKFSNGMLLLCIAQLCMIQITAIHFTPKVEAYSQRAAIEFYQQQQGKDVDVQPLGFKSYAHLFYTQKQPPSLPPEDSLLNAPLKRPALFICKLPDSARYAAMPQLQVTGSKNGFVFLQRK